MCVIFSSAFSQKHSTYNAYLMAGLGMGSIAPHTNNTAATGGTAQTTGLTIGGAALLNYGAGASSAAKQHHALHHNPYYYRHSLTNRHRVLRTRSSGATHKLWDEQALEVRTYVCKYVHMSVLST